MSSRTDLTCDFNRLYADAVGSMGLEESELERFADRATVVHRAVFDAVPADRPGFLRLPDQLQAAQEIAAAVTADRRQFKNFVVLGIGGSALGNTALQTALNHPFYNFLPANKRGGCPRIFVLDNIDPDLIAGLTEALDPAETLFNVISKSGQTAETMAQFLYFIRLLSDRLGDEAADHMIITTDATSGPLRAAADTLGCRSYAVPDGVGGRFTVLSPVGLISAAYAGIDIEGLLQGAARMRERCQSASMMENPALFYSAAHYLLNTVKKTNISVLFAYAQRLKDLADWYRQLLAESLGKRRNLDGDEVSLGVTPVKALGVTDQHSQVQLYVEGPRDKAFTFLTVDSFAAQVTIPSRGKIPEGQDYLAGSTFNSLLDAELRGTELALQEAGRPSCRITFPKVTAETVGQFLLMMELHIAYSGLLYNVNAFDQPGVEAGKRATFALMGRAGFEELRQRILAEKGRADRIMG